MGGGVDVYRGAIYGSVRAKVRVGALETVVGEKLAVDAAIAGLIDILQRVSDVNMLCDASLPRT